MKKNWAVLKGKPGSQGFGNQHDLVKAANLQLVGEGGLVVCLANKNEYTAWINTDTKSYARPTRAGGAWHTFHVDGKVAETVADKLNELEVEPGNVTVTVNGRGKTYIVVYYK